MTNFEIQLFTHYPTLQKVWKAIDGAYFVKFKDAQAYTQSIGSNVLDEIVRPVDLPVLPDEVKIDGPLWVYFPDKDSPVATFNGRNGNILPLQGDYNAEQITGFAEKTQSVMDSKNISIDIATANTKAEQAIAIANTANLQGVRLGAWNASTNTPALTADASAVVQGGFYDVVVAGTQAITGTSRLFVAGERIAKIGNGWYAIPNSLSEKSVTPEKTTFVEVLANPEYIYAISDTEDNILFAIKLNGELVGRFITGDSTILRKHLGDELLKVLPVNADNTFTGDALYQIVDADDNILAEINKKGKLKAVFDYALSKIRQEDVAEGYRLMCETADSPFLDYSYLVVDSEDNILFGIKKNGSVVAKIQLIDKSVMISQLADEVTAKLPSTQFLRENSYNSSDTEIIDDDDLWRGNEIELPVRTNNRTGFLFKRFAAIKCNGIRGLNTTGTSLDFRIGETLTIRGEKYISDYNNVSPNLITDKGWFRSDTPSLPSNPSAGDFYICIFWYLDAKTRTVAGVTMSEWDILFFNGVSWQIQVSPASSINLKDNDFFNIVSDGKFWNMNLKNGDRLTFLGTKTGGGYNEPIWLTQKAGEYYVMGECNPSSFAPTNPKEYDLYVVSADGSFASIDFKKGDYLFRLLGAWGKCSSNIITIANNTAFSIPCINAKQISIRRSDKSSVDVDLVAKVSCTLVSRKVSNDIVLYSDSMFGSNVGTSIADLLSSRVVTTQSFGGASTNNLLSMIKANIRKNDLYGGRLHAFWHGQNNNTDLVQIKSGALEMASLVGVQQSKFVMWSMLGQLGMRWNGTRLVDDNHEDAFKKTNNSRFVEIEDYYDVVFRGKHFSPRKAALASAVGRTRKSLQFPAMTEEQVALTYGIPPFSYFFNFASVTWNPNDLVFTGYFSAAGLPSGGAVNDYKIRTANGSAGQIIVNVAGVWTEYNHDVTHVTLEGGQNLAQQFINFLNAKSL